MKKIKLFFINKYSFGFLVLLSLLALIDWFIFGRTPLEEIKNVKSQVAQTFISKDQIVNQSEESLENEMNKNDSSTLSAAGMNSAAQSQETSLPQKTIIDPRRLSLDEFKIWFGNEALRMNAFNVNEDELRAYYLQLTQKMKREQFDLLLNKTLDFKIEAQQRVLSAYLLSHAGYELFESLAQVVSQESQFKKPAPAHSSDETFQMQEKALKVMLVNRLFELAKGPDRKKALEAKNKLIALIPQIKDPSVKNYAQNKIKEL